MELTELQKQNKRILDQLQKEFPPEALKERVGGGGKKFTYIEGHAAIHRVLDVTFGAYDMEYITHWIYQDTDVKGKARHTLNMLIYVDIPGLGKKIGHGVQVLGIGEDMAKGALTDAYKNAMKYNGQGLGLYGDDYEFEPEPVVEPPRKRLSKLLKEKGISSTAAFDKAAQAKYNVDGKELTDAQVTTWLAELEKEGVPF